MRAEACVFDCLFDDPPQVRIRERPFLAARFRLRAHMNHPDHSFDLIDMPHKQ
jgi:hypothetical protein